MNLLKAIEKLAKVDGHHTDLFKLFDAFLTCAACALSAGRREDEYMAEVDRWENKDVIRAMPEVFAELVMAMEERPFYDHLGDAYQELRSQSSRTAGGDFYTPHELCRMMANMLRHEPPADRAMELMEPAVGSGRMVMAVAQDFVERGYSPLNLRATCIDVSKSACDMAFINLTLSSIPARVIHGNTLSGETWADHSNPLWILARPSCGEPSDKSPDPPALPSPASEPQVDGQFSFDMEL